MNKRFIWILGIGLTLACNLLTPAAPATPDLLATLQAVTPSGAYPVQSPTPIASPNFSFTVEAPTISPTQQVNIPSPSSGDAPTGHIVFTCQVFKVQSSDQICIMNADGSGYKRLTTDDSRRHFYPSLSPDGKSVLYSSFREENIYEIYEMQISDGKVTQLTNKLGVANAPEVSPDGGSITFMRWTVSSDQNQIWVMKRSGGDPNNIPKIIGWDPTWSPDSKYILFASNMDGTNQLYTININGKNLKRITNLPALRGRSDWSPDGQKIVTYSGEAWHREVYIMNADGSNLQQLSPTGGNAQGPSFSPDGKWVAFTAYYDNYGDDHGCEIYISRLDGSDLRRLTNNDYCDYQPRWGP